MKATVAGAAVDQEHPRAGETVRGGTVPRRRRPARAARRQVPRKPQPASLRLVAADGRLISRASGEAVRTTPGPDAPSPNAPRPNAPSPDAPPAGAPRPAAARPSTPRPGALPATWTPVRLTRRGRLVVTAAALLVIAAVSVVLAGGAQALGHSGGAAPTARLGAGITRVQVQPGQDLWTLAEAYDPNADPRQVIQEIQQLNSMSTDQLQPGQVLWMPRE